MDKHLKSYSGRTKKRRSIKRLCKSKLYWNAKLTNLWKTMKCKDFCCIRFKCSRTVKTQFRKLFLDSRRLFDKSLRNAERLYQQDKVIHLESICTEMAYI